MYAQTSEGFFTQLVCSTKLKKTVQLKLGKERCHMLFVAAISGISTPTAEKSHDVDPRFLPPLSTLHKNR